VKGGKSGPTGRIKAQEARAGSREQGAGSREQGAGRKCHLLQIENCKMQNEKFKGKRQGRNFSLKIYGYRV
jgi:hypothetical protein